MIVFSHLRWEFVTQRPQHIISRFAKDHTVLFVEEPIEFSDPFQKGTAHIFKAGENITVLQPRIDSQQLIHELEPIIRKQMEEFRIQEPILWFYSPAFHEMTNKIDHSLVVYDCMDELSAFKGAPRQLVEQEKELLRKAGVVFTGGKSLYEAKAKISHRVYCYPSSVDREHFGKSLDEATPVPDDIRALPRPVVGYHGVIDERIDLELLEETAGRNPDISFVMIGPVVKIAEGDLPRRENLCYLGGKPYSELPGYLKAFDIAMMPFALNESTRFISPTKTLEYIAGKKPVISTAINDVVRDYGEVIPIVKDAAGFTTAIRNFLGEGPADKTGRAEKYEDILRKVSWDKTVASMKLNIEHAITPTPMEE